MASGLNRLARNTLGAPVQLPGVPKLFPDECLSSWLRRCAIKYRSKTSFDFVAGLLALDGLTLRAGHYDWDSAPPLVVLQSLEARGGVTMQQLVQHLCSPESVLRPGEKDAYCPECFVDDLQHGTPYVRLAWIDPWVLKCNKHGCPLGCYAAVSLDRSPVSAQERLWKELTWLSRVYRINLDQAILFSPSGEPQSHELHLDWQRRVMLTLGFPAGQRLFYALTAESDLCWLDDAGNPGNENSVFAPKASIRWRLMAARAVHALGAMATPKTLALTDPAKLASALLRDLARAQRWRDLSPRGRGRSPLVIQAVEVPDE